MNDYLLILPKRATQIMQDKEQDITCLNINAAISQASREFKERKKKENDFKRAIREIIQ